MNLHKPEVQDALRTLNAEYFSEVRDWAEDYTNRIKLGEFPDREAFDDTFREELDGAQCVIYTYQAQLVILCSDNSSNAQAELEDMGIEHPTYEQTAYQCLMLDVLDHMGDVEELFAEGEESEES